MALGTEASPARYPAPRDPFQTTPIGDIPQFHRYSPHEPGNNGGWYGSTPEAPNPYAPIDQSAWAANDASVRAAAENPDGSQAMPWDTDNTAQMPAVEVGVTVPQPRVVVELPGETVSEDDPPARLEFESSRAPEQELVSASVRATGYFTHKKANGNFAPQTEEEDLDVIHQDAAEGSFFLIHREPHCDYDLSGFTNALTKKVKKFADLAGEVTHEEVQAKLQQTVDRLLTSYSLKGDISVSALLFKAAQDGKKSIIGANYGCNRLRIDRKNQGLSETLGGIIPTHDLLPAGGFVARVEGFVRSAEDLERLEVLSELGGIELDTPEKERDFRQALERAQDMGDPDAAASEMAQLYKSRQSKHAPGFSMLLIQPPYVPPAEVEPENNEAQSGVISRFKETLVKYGIIDQEAFEVRNEIELTPKGKKVVAAGAVAVAAGATYLGRDKLPKGLTAKISKVTKELDAQAKLASGKSWVKSRFKR